MRVLVVGAAGQLGRAMMVRLSDGHELIAVTRQEADLSDHERVRALAHASRASAIVNCAAYTNVDGAEDDFRTALEINAMAVRTLARAAEDLDATLLHFSTDFVFAGTGNRPHAETDLPEPQSVYAQSKLVGEWMAAAWKKHYVFRVESLFGGPNARSSVDKIIDGVRRGVDTPVFHDRVVSPSFVDDVVAASKFALEQRIPYGLYHCVNTGMATWHDVGRHIATLAGSGDQMLRAVSVNDVKLRASRPKYAALSNAKLKAAGFEMPTWQDALRRYVK
jgi:dTDP-4-dehydrorhamnose reductase